MSRRERREKWLHAWQDGELRGLSSLRAARAVRRSPEARRELEAVRAVGDRVRQVVASDEAGPDLWPAIAARLPAADAARAAAADAPARSWLLRPLVAGAAVAAAGVALVVGLLLQPQASGDVVQWLDSAGAPVMVLDGPDDTVIWMLGPTSDEISGSAPRVAA